MANTKAKSKAKTQTKTKVVKPTVEEMILGQTEEVKVVQEYDYTSREALYEVKVFANGRKIKVNGKEIGTFLGMDYASREAIKAGAKSVLIKDDNGKELYKIEVI